MLMSLSFALFGFSGCILYDNEEGLLNIAECGEEASVPDGLPCVCNFECASGTCFSEGINGIPKGQCGRECERNRDCELGDVCEIGLCYPSCRLGQDECLPSRICASVTDGEPNEGFCFPLCQSDDHCETLNCDLYSGECLPPEEVSSGLGIAAECDNDEACRSGFCFEGGCYTTCSVEDQVCPERADCAPRFGDWGVCTFECGERSDCRGLGFRECVDFEDDDDDFCFVEP